MVSFFKKIYDSHVKMFSIYDGKIFEQIEKMYDFNPLVASPINEFYRQYWNILQTNCNKSDDSADNSKIVDQIFQLNLKLVHLHQNQLYLVELTKRKQQVSSKVSDNRTEYSFTRSIRPNHNIDFLLDNVKNLLLQLRKMIGQLQEEYEKFFQENCPVDGIKNLSTRMQ